MHVGPKQAKARESLRKHLSGKAGWQRIYSGRMEVAKIRQMNASLGTATTAIECDRELMAGRLVFRGRLTTGLSNSVQDGGAPKQNTRRNDRR